MLSRRLCIFSSVKHTYTFTHIPTYMHTLVHTASIFISRDAIQCRLAEKYDRVDGLRIIVPLTLRKSVLTRDFAVDYRQDRSLPRIRRSIKHFDLWLSTRIRARATLGGGCSCSDDDVVVKDYLFDLRCVRGSD